jgi:glycosyltransferase involved in cell wall biosynthesis
MNILMVHPHDLFSRREPWTIRIVSIAREFVKRGHSVRLCYFPVSSEISEEPCHIKGIETIPLDRRHSPLTFMANTRKLVKLCRQSEVVHFQKCHYYSSLSTVMAARITGKPLHYDWDDWEEKIWYESVENGLYARCIGISYKVLERCLPLLADSVSCASSHLGFLTESFGVPRDFIVSAPVGADLERFRPDLHGNRIRERYGIGGNLVVYVGQLHGAQHVDLLIEAAALVLTKMPDAMFMIVGEGFLERQLKDLTRDLGLERRVLFTGSVPHEEVPFYMAAADVCIASFKETEVTRCKSPLKLAEYLASGKPIVASRVGEVEKMVSEGGIVVEPGEAKSLAEGILTLLGDRDLREKMGRSGRLMAETVYNWPRTASTLLATYQKIVQENR